MSAPYEEEARDQLEKVSRALNRDRPNRPWEHRLAEGQLYALTSIAYSLLAIEQHIRQAAEPQMVVELT